jgi:hypothetical protein
VNKLNEILNSYYPKEALKTREILRGILNEEEIDSLIPLVSGYTDEEFELKLPMLAIRTKSFFWLAGDLKYLEVIFWSIIGVLVSVLYFVSEAMRDKNFRTEELPIYFAKLFYAPVIVFIIMLGYTRLTATGELNFDDTSAEIIVVSFILGFFSGRAVELLNRIKDVLLPLGKASTNEKNKYSIKGNLIIEGAANDEEKDKIRRATEVSLVPLLKPKEVSRYPIESDYSFSASNLSPDKYKVMAIVKGDHLGTFISPAETVQLTEDRPAASLDIKLEKKTT